MNLVYESMPEWPRLAWLAEGSSADDTVTVRHGPWVETRGEWFCEAVWDGAFSSGDFDRTPIVAGTGGRIREGRLRFVAAGSNLDRLHTFRRGDAFYVSNSLSCLMAWVDAGPMLSYRDYNADFADYRNAVLGDHVRTIPTTAGSVDMTYFADLVWMGDAFAVVEKPTRDLDFHDFPTYRACLVAAIGRMAENAGDPERSRAFGVACPVSSGYDSSAVTALASAAARPSAFSFKTDREGRDDSGEALATRLGLPFELVDRDAWRDAPLAEVPFIACSGSVGDVSFKGAEALLEGKLLLVGSGTEPFWNKNKVGGERLEFGDGALLGLLEYRLDAGFVLYPVVYVGLHQLEEVAAITASEAMAPWDVGGAHSKPICRRIVEEAGMPREAFGMVKKGVSNVPVRGEFLSASSRADFLDWLAARRADGDRHMPSPQLARVLDAILTPVARSVGTAELLTRRGRASAPALVGRGLRFLRKRLRQPYYHHAYVTHWAMDRARDRYRTART